MLSLDPGISYERLITPREHGELLVEPACALWPTTSPARRATAVALAGRALVDLRRQLRAALNLPDGLLIATGHQAEFFHAGVLAKSIATALFAERHGGRAVFVTVDSDVPKSLTVATAVAEAHEVRRERVALPGLDSESAGGPLEWVAPVSKAAWRRFFAELGRRAPQADTLRTFADAALDCAGDDVTPASVVERGQNAVLTALGCAPLEVVRVSQLAETAAFRAFTADWIAEARAFALHYNAAQRAFRKRHRVRNPRRPVPLLEITDRETELPFWAQRRGGRRQTLTVLADGDRCALRAGDQSLGCISPRDVADASQAAGGWWFERDGWQIRPKALLLSGFARLLLSDLFIHGIGGGKYDEMTDAFLARIVGEAPAPLAVVSATLMLPLPSHGITEEQLRAARQRHRDLRYNPQRHLGHLPAELLERRAGLIEESQRLRAQRPPDRAARRRVFHEIHDVNHALLHSDLPQAVAIEEEIRALQHAARCDRVARDREYFFGLHSLGALRGLCEALGRRMELP